MTRAPLSRGGARSALSRADSDRSVSERCLDGAHYVHPNGVGSKPVMREGASESEMSLSSGGALLSFAPFLPPLDILFLAKRPAIYSPTPLGLQVFMIAVTTYSDGSHARSLFKNAV
ncbi:hypothetical protein EVAR_20186_1 [Eumeta japonica]|uniref:Uncharacterized protein n=1 Tax=Eumeta variegata TaxID=151549 RepID=A0A4C1UV12_EUMVA|nr:hypothetical protein EVAR_20186_1 [Eumeta japonica]